MKTNKIFAWFNQMQVAVSLGRVAFSLLLSVFLFSCSADTFTVAVEGLLGKKIKDIGFVDDVEIGPASFDDIIIRVNYPNADASSFQYVFTASPTCQESTFSSGTAKSFTSDVKFTITDETSNNFYICARAKNTSGEAVYAASKHPLNVDAISPTLVFVIDVPSTLAKEAVIKIKASDINLDDTSLKYGFSIDAVCNADDSYTFSFLNDGDVTITDDTNSGKYICARAKDKAGNIAYKPSANLLQIDLTDPSIVFTDNVELGPVKSDAVAIKISDANLDNSKTKYIFSSIATCDSSVDFSAGTLFSSPTWNFLSSVWSRAFDNETENGKYICVKAEDLVGRISYKSSTKPLNIDAIDPVISFDKNVLLGPVISNEIKISVTDVNTDINSYKFAYTDTSTCDATVSFTNSFTSGSDFTIGDESHNDKFICVTAQDKAGRKAFQLSSHKLNIDIIPPKIDFDNDVAVGPIGTDEINILVTDKNPDTTTYRYIFIDSTAVCDNSIASLFLATSPTYTSGENFLLNTMANNGKYLCAKAKDKAGNISYKKTTNPLNIDTNVPSVVVTNVPATYSKEITPIITTVGTAGLDYVVIPGTTCDGSVNFTPSLGGSIYGTYTSGSVALTLGIEAKSGWYLCARATNALGNIGYGISTSFKIDTTLPVVNFSDSVSSVLTNKDTIKIDVTEAHLGSTGTLKYGFTTALTHSAALTECGDKIKDATLFTNNFTSGSAFDILDQTNNGKYLCAVVIDEAGNRGLALSANPLNVDAVDPAIVFAPDVSATPVTSDTVTITITDANAQDANYDYKYAFTDTVAACDATANFTNNFKSGAAFTLNNETHNGKYICARGEDKATRISYKSSANPLNIDITPPTVMLSGTPTLTSNHYSNLSSFLVSVGTADVKEHQSAVVSGNSCASATYGAWTAVGTKINVSPSTDGEYALCVKGRDALNNEQVLPTIFTWKRDTQAPTATYTGEPANPSNVTALNITLGTADTTHYKYKVGAFGTATCSNSADYSTEVVVSTPITQNISSLADGNLTLCVVARDEAGNWQAFASATSYTWKKMTTPSTASLSGAPADGSINKFTQLNNIDVTGSVVAFRYVLIGPSASPACPSSIGGYQLEVAINTTPGQYEIHGITIGGADGQYRLCVLGKDAANNWQDVDAPTTVTWTKDTTPPTAPTLAGAPTGASKESSFTVTVSNPADATEYKYGVVAGSTCTGVTYGSWTPKANSFTVSPLAGDGQYTLCVMVKDSAGNESALTSSTWTKDTVSPAVPTLTGAPTGVSKENSFTVTVSDPADATHYKYAVVSGSSCSSPVPTYSSWTAMSSSFAAVPPSPANDGQYTLCVVVKDSAGNESAVKSSTWTKDTIPPTITMTGEPTGTNNVMVLNVTVSGANGLTHYQSKVGASNTTDCSTATGYSADITAATKITSSLPEDGELKLCVKGRDAAGNWTLPLSAVWIKDTTPPSSVNLSGTPLNNSTDAVLNVKISGADVVQYKYALVSGGSCTSPVPTYSVWVNTNTNITAGVPSPEGEYTLCVIGKDATGNEQVVATAYTWMKLNVLTVTVSRASGQAELTNNSTIKFTVVFNLPINTTTFTSDDFTQSGTSLLSSWAITNPSNDKKTFGVQVTATTGTILLSMAKDLVEYETNSALKNQASTGNESVEYDLRKPWVFVMQSLSQNDPGNDPNSILFDVCFGLPIQDSTFTNSDVDLSGTATSKSVVSIVKTGTARDSRCQSDNYVLTVKATSTNATGGTVIPSIAADKVLSLAGNGNQLSNNQTGTYDDTVTIDTIAPTGVGLTQYPTGGNPPNLDVIVSSKPLEEAVKYQYVLGKGSCPATGYSTDMPIANKIADSLSTFDNGDVIYLCVKGKDAAGNLQTNVTSVHWTKNTSDPAVTATGTPSGTNNTVSFTAVVSRSNTNTAYFKYKILDTTSSDTCHATGTGYAGQTTIDDSAQSLPISVSGKADGTIRLCLLGVGVDGSTLGTTPTVYTWTKNTSKPKILAAETMDKNKNGKLDGYKITFDRAVKDSTFPGYATNAVTTDWNVFNRANVKFDKSITEDVTNDEVIYIMFDENSAPCNGFDQSGCDGGNKPDLTMTAIGLQDLYGNGLAVFGSTTVAEEDRVNPILLRGLAPSNLSVELIFSENIDIDTAECGAGSSKPTVVCSTLYTANSGMIITKAVIATIPSNRVILTTSSQTNGNSYTVTVQATASKDMSNNPTLAGSNSVSFPGAPPALVLLSAEAISNTMVKLKFNEPVTGGGTALSNYSISGGLSVTAAIFDNADSTNKTVLLTTSSQDSDTPNGYTVTVTALSSSTGTIKTGNNMATFTGDKLPEIVSITSIDANTIYVTFSEDVKFDTSASGAFATANYTFTLNGPLVLSAPVSKAANKVVQFTTANQAIETLYEIEVKNVQDLHGNAMHPVNNRGKFFGQEGLKILTARNVLGSNNTLGIFRVTFSKPFMYDAAGLGANSASNLNNWKFPFSGVSVCTAADDSACPVSYGSSDTEIFFKVNPKPGKGAYTLVGATQAGTPLGAVGCIYKNAGTVNNDCLKSDPFDRAVVSWELPKIVEEGSVYTDPFSDGTLSGQVVRYNNKLLIGPNKAYSGVFQTDINLENPVSVLFDSEDTKSGIQPFKDPGNNTILESSTGGDSSGSGTLVNVPLSGIDYMYAACAHNTLGQEIDHTLSGSACTAAGGTERLYIVGYTENPSSCYQSVWITEDKVSPFAFKHIRRIGCVVGKSFRAMSLKMFQGFIYQASQMQGQNWMPLVSVYSPTGLLGGQQAIGAVSNNYYDSKLLRQVAANALFDLSWGLVTRIGGEGTFPQLPNEKRVNGNYKSMSLTSVDTMFVYKGDNTPARMYIANGGWVNNTHLTNKIRPIPPARAQQYQDAYLVDGGIVRSAHDTTDGVSSYTSPEHNPDRIYDANLSTKKYLQGNIASDGNVNRHWEDVTPGANYTSATPLATEPAVGTANRAAYIWNMFMSKALPKDASQNKDWSFLVPANTIAPSIKAVPKMVEFNGDLYIIRNACSTVEVKTLSGSVHDTCTEGNERPQLWRLPKNCGTAVQCASKWEFIGNTTSADAAIKYTTRMGGAVWVDGNEKDIKTAKNRYITLLEAVGDRLYVGFDNETNGVNIWRTKTGVTVPTSEADFEAVCQTGSACFQPEKQFGMTTSATKTDIKIFDSLPISDSGKNYLIFNARGGSNPLRVYRQGNN